MILLPSTGPPSTSLEGMKKSSFCLLGAIVAYLTRGRGNAQVLASEMQASAKGARLGQWMLKHEEALKKHPDLQLPKPQQGAFGPTRNRR